MAIAPVSRVEIWTDGACSGNPGPGGFGVPSSNSGPRPPRRLAGGEPLTTNNRMELSLRRLRRPGDAEDAPAASTCNTDSQYLRLGVTQWLKGWKRNGWRTADKKPVKNEDLWRRLDEAAAGPRHRLALGEGPCWRRDSTSAPTNSRASGMKPFLPTEARRGLSHDGDAEVYAGPHRRIFHDVFGDPRRSRLKPDDDGGRRAWLGLVSTTSTSSQAPKSGFACASRHARNRRRSRNVGDVGAGSS